MLGISDDTRAVDEGFQHLNTEMGSEEHFFVAFTELPGRAAGADTGGGADQSGGLPAVHERGYTHHGGPAARRPHLQHGRRRR